MEERINFISRFFLLRYPQEHQEPDSHEQNLIERPSCIPFDLCQHSRDTYDENHLTSRSKWRHLNPIHHISAFSNGIDDHSYQCNF